MSHTTTIPPRQGQPNKPAKTVGAVAIQAARRQFQTDVKFLKTQYAATLAKLQRRIAQLERENFELKKAAPLPFDPTPYIVDGKVISSPQSGSLVEFKSR